MQGFRLNFHKNKSFFRLNFVIPLIDIKNISSIIIIGVKGVYFIQATKQEVVIMDVLNIVLYCAIILTSTKLFGMLTRKFGLPQVVGMIIAGLLIGPAIFSLFNFESFKGIIVPSTQEMNVLKSFSQIGVIFILFSSGLETDIGKLKKSGGAATGIALLGVAVPVILGTLGSLFFMGGIGEITNKPKLMNALFIGCILAATSVGITVETLRELGKLNTKVGTTILRAAIIDDVIGILLLSIITGLNGKGSIGATLLKAVGFFKFLVTKYPHKRRTSVFAISMCFVFAYCAEKFFGIAAITGAYMAGLMLSGLDDTSFVDRKVIVSGYMIFTPMFFAYIGISADFSSFTLSGLLFAAVFVFLGIIGKIVGCGGISRAFGYKGRDSIGIGCGMIARGEVALAVYATGQSLIYYGDNGVLLGIDPLVATILLIVTSSVLCPIFLKLCFKNTSHETLDKTNHKTRISSEALDHFYENTGESENLDKASVK